MSVNTSPAPGVGESTGATFKSLVSEILNVKRQRVASGELASQSLDAYKRPALALAKFFGDESHVEAVIAHDFRRFREHLGKERELTWKPDGWTFHRITVDDRQHGVHLWTSQVAGHLSCWSTRGVVTTTRDKINV